LGQAQVVSWLAEAGDPDGSYLVAPVKLLVTTAVTTVFAVVDEIALLPASASQPDRLRGCTAV
jgi:hypothetical protein